MSDERRQEASLLSYHLSLITHHSPRMTRRRFYAPPGAFTADTVLLSEEESRHLRDVLRLRAGDEAHVFDGEGREFACVVVEAGGRKASARLEVRGPVEPPSPESTLEL